jgi:Rps23 Pro-64 3,4-dihydroxylase Tpa1-like proline 4-hydroxylase
MTTATPTFEAPSLFNQFRNFLSKEEVRYLLDYAAAHEKEFIAGTVTTKQQDYRHARVLHQFPFADYMRYRVFRVFERAAKAVGMSVFPMGKIEAQMTAHNEGDYFQVHNDSGDKINETRMLTFVYYFHKEPKVFSGGELTLFPTLQSIPLSQQRVHGSVVVEPQCNSLVVFPSACYHQVSPVVCASKKFVDSRFTVNGWVRRRTP